MVCFRYTITNTLQKGGKYNNNNEKRPDIVLHDKKDKTYLLIDIAILDDLNINKKETNIKQVQRLGDRGQKDVECLDKNCAIYN